MAPKERTAALAGPVATVTPEDLEQMARSVSAESLAPMGWSAVKDSRDRLAEPARRAGAETWAASEKMAKTVPRAVTVFVERMVLTGPSVPPARPGRMAWLGPTGRKAALEALEPVARMEETAETVEQATLSEKMQF